MIRKARSQDLSRIAEILVFDKRMYYRPIFHDDAYAFGELQVLKLVGEYAAPDVLDAIWVYDDGIVKGMIHIEGREIVELYVDCFFQGQGIGAELMEFAVSEYCADCLWVIEKNASAIRFYQARGFSLTGERQLEAGTSEYIVRMERRSAAH